MTKQLKTRSLFYLAGLCIYATAIWASYVWVLNDQLKFIWFLAAYLIVGMETFKNFRDKLLDKKLFSEHMMIIMATIGAFGIERYTEGILVMILFEMGMLLQAFVESAAKYSIMKVAEGGQKAEALAKEAAERKSESELRVLAFLRFYAPVMVVLIMIFMIYPPMTFSYNNWDSWVYRGLIFLIIACPTGMVKSIPVAYYSGMAMAAKNGIFFKGADSLESMAKADTYLFSKTGVLTQGRFVVSEVYPVGVTEEKLLEIAVCAECQSKHPIAQGLREAWQKYGKVIDEQKLMRATEVPGYGISATYDGQRIHVGNARLMQKKHIRVEQVRKKGTAVYVAKGRDYMGYILLEDELRNETAWTLKKLRDKYNTVTVMLTGDSEKAGESITENICFDYVYSELTPDEKSDRTAEFLEIQDSTERVVCIGDGVKDLKMLSKADVGIAFGMSDETTADVVLAEKKLTGIIDTVRIAKETQKVVNQNIRYAFLMKAAIFVFAFMGCFGMWEAIIAEVGIMIVSMLNSVFLVYYKV